MGLGKAGLIVGSATEVGLSDSGLSSFGQAGVESTVYFNPSQALWLNF